MSIGPLCCGGGSSLGVWAGGGVNNHVFKERPGGWEENGQAFGEGPVFPVLL